MIPSHLFASICASVIARTGGVSIKTISNSLYASTILRPYARVPNSSAGFGGLDLPPLNIHSQHLFFECIALVSLVLIISSLIHFEL